MKTKQCLVIGLGRFGTAVATTLYEMGHEVVAIDQLEDNVERVMNLVTHAAIVDATEERALRAIGVGDCILAIDGQDLTASTYIQKPLEGTAGHAITLKVASANGAAPHDVVVIPARTEAQLRDVHAPAGVDNHLAGPRDVSPFLEE